MNMDWQKMEFIPKNKTKTARIDTVAASSVETSLGLEEINAEAEVKEGLETMKGSANRWAWIMSDYAMDHKKPDTKFLAELLLNQKNELPELVSSVLERTCNLQCSHCLYQEEKSSSKISQEVGLGDKIVHIVDQMPQRSDQKGEEYDPKFLSCGRILRPWHLDIFTKLRSLRPDVKLGVIDNGTFTSLLPNWPEDFKFDWVDISIDGVEESHNKQRQSPKAFAQAIEGLRQARRVTLSPEEGGRVTSLLTLTKINARDITEVADKLLANETESGLPLVDQFGVTTVGPTNEINSLLETDVDDFRAAWNQIVSLSRKYNVSPGSPKVKLSIYRIQDMEKLAAVIGEDKFMQAFTPSENDALQISAERNFLILNFDGVEVQYQPNSIWTPEEFLIEADGVYRSAYEGKFTLEELRSGTSSDNKDTTAYSFESITDETDFRKTFEKAVDMYYQRFGKEKLAEEMETIARIQEKAKNFH